MAPNKMQEITDQHIRLYESVWESLGSWRQFLIGIDGWDGAGKSTLSRFLSWQMGMPAIETDLFILSENEIDVTYRSNDLTNQIDARFGRDRPVIVEGILLLQTLREIKRRPDYIIYVKNEDNLGGHLTEESVLPYESEFQPDLLANFTFTWNPEPFDPDEE